MTSSSNPVKVVLNLPSLMPYERRILEEIAGIHPPSSWGAAVGAALEFLRGNGLISRDGKITPEGRRALQAPEPK